MYEKLLEAMQEKGVTRNKLALLAGITSQDIYAVLSGKRFMYPGWKKRIAEALNMPESELFEEESINKAEAKKELIRLEKKLEETKARMQRISEMLSGQ